jgi:hypothetical protein
LVSSGGDVLVEEDKESREKWGNLISKLGFMRREKEVFTHVCLL